MARRATVTAQLDGPGDRGSKPRIQKSRFDEQACRFFDALSHPFYALDGSWRFLFINRAAAASWGRDRDGLIGKSLWESFPQARDSEPFRLHQDALSGGRPIDVQTVSPVISRPIRLMIKPNADMLSVSFSADPRRRLLLAEDSELVAEVLSGFLDEQGWSVTAATSGATARAAIEHLKFDVVLTDDMLPGARGSALARSPHLAATPVLLMSGYPRDGSASHEERAHFLAKPFRLEKLADALSSLLAKPGDPPG